jgi:methylmalonyl-CoA mutase N-terminal domain/subunit
MEPIGEAVRAYATVGEIMGALVSVFGRWQEVPSI